MGRPATAGKASSNLAISPNACFFGALEHGIARRAVSGAYFVTWINRSLIRFLRRGS
jgi:hypothetical protein